MAVDYYAVLGIERGASEADVKRAYRSLARQHHPDVAEDKAAAETKFKEINEAYEVLSDPEKRRMYDRYGSGDGNGSFGTAAGDGIGDIFDMFFGGGRRGVAAAPRTAARAPTCATICRSASRKPTGEPSARSRSITSRFAKRATGNGSRPGTFPVTCDRCNGTGVMRSVRQTPLGPIRHAVDVREVQR